MANGRHLVWEQQTNYEEIQATIANVMSRYEQVALALDPYPGV